MVIAFIGAMAAEAATLQPALQPLAPLVGHCFTGPAPGNQGTDKHCFESVYGGQHIRDRHVVTVGGKDAYAGETLYSANRQLVVFTYWNSLGGIGTGEADLRSDRWNFTGTIHATPDSAEQPIAATWTLVPDGYQVSGKEGPRLFKRAD